VVTTSYHVFRALLIARRMHLPCKGFGAKTKWYYTLNALIREYVGYVSLSYRLHIFVLVILSGLLLLANILPRYLH
jgi:putative membrane protein